MFAQIAGNAISGVLNFLHCVAESISYHFVCLDLGAPNSQLASPDKLELVRHCWGYLGANNKN